MKFVFYDQCELCADTICNILQTERIPYKVKSKRLSMFGQILYDISIDTDLEHWLFVQKIAVDKLTPYMRAEKSYMLPSYSKDTKTLNVDGHTPVILIDKLQKENNFEWEIVLKKSKKSLLKRLIDYLTNNY